MGTPGDLASVGPQGRTAFPGSEGLLDQRATVGLVTVETLGPEAKLDPGVLLETKAHLDLLFLEQLETGALLVMPVPRGLRDFLVPRVQKEHIVRVSPRVQALQERRATLESQAGPELLGPLASEELQEQMELKESEERRDSLGPQDERGPQDQQEQQATKGQRD